MGDCRGIWLGETGEGGMLKSGVEEMRGESGSAGEKEVIALVVEVVRREEGGRVDIERPVGGRVIETEGERVIETEGRSDRDRG